MNHICDAADHINRVEHINCLRAVWHCDGYLIALANAYGFKRAGASAYFCHHFFIGGVFAHEGKGDFVRICFCDFFNLFKHGAFEICQVHWGIAHIRFPRCFCCYIAIIKHNVCLSCIDICYLLETATSCDSGSSRQCGFSKISRRSCTHLL